MANTALDLDTAVNDASLPSHLEAPIQFTYHEFNELLEFTTLVATLQAHHNPASIMHLTQTWAKRIKQTLSDAASQYDNPGYASMAKCAEYKAERLRVSRLVEDSIYSAQTKLEEARRHLESYSSREEESRLHYHTRQTASRDVMLCKALLKFRDAKNAVTVGHPDCAVVYEDGMTEGEVVGLVEGYLARHKGLVPALEESAGGWRGTAESAGGWGATEESANGWRETAESAGGWRETEESASGWGAGEKSAGGWGVTEELELGGKQLRDQQVDGERLRSQQADENSLSKIVGLIEDYLAGCKGLVPALEESAGRIETA